MKKPTWVIEKERSRRAAAAQTVWLFGLHAVRDALLNPVREKLRLVATKNALDRLGSDVGDMPVELADARKFPVPLDPGSVHQGVALEVKPLDWGKVADVCRPSGKPDVVVLLDRVTDPHNVGASCDPQRSLARGPWWPRSAIRPRKPARWQRPRPVRWNGNPISG